MKVETKYIKYVGKEFYYDRNSIMVNGTRRFELPKDLIMGGFLCCVNMNDVILCTPGSH